MRTPWLDQQSVAAAARSAGLSLKPTHRPRSGPDGRWDTTVLKPYVGKTVQCACTVYMMYIYFYMYMYVYIGVLYVG